MLQFVYEDVRYSNTNAPGSTCIDVRGRSGDALVFRKIHWKLLEWKEAKVWSTKTRGELSGLILVPTQITTHVIRKEVCHISTGGGQHRWVSSPVTFFIKCWFLVSAENWPGNRDRVPRNQPRLSRWLAFQLEENPLSPERRKQQDLGDAFLHKTLL